MIQHLEDGRAVPGPGQYDMSMDHYHSQACCPGPSVSSTGLRTIYHQSAADFWAFSELNDNRFEKEASEAFTFGRAAHALLLGDEDFDAKFAVVPDDAPPKPLDSQWAMLAAGRKLTDSAAERLGFWRPFLEANKGKELLSQSDLKHIKHIGENLARHPIVPVLMEGEAEQSLIWQDEKTGLWVKSRLDILSSTGDLADLKSTVMIEPRRIKKSIGEHGYDMQLGLATMALENVLGVPFNTEVYASRAAILLFVYKRPPYHVTPVELSFDALHHARLKCRFALDRLADCIIKNEWPGPSDGILNWDTPEWEVEKIAESQAAGLFPTVMT